MQTNSDNLVALRKTSLSLGGKSLWQDMSLNVRPGEFIAVLGPNGAGKTSLINVLLGLLPLASGSIEIDGNKPHCRSGNKQIGYIPQQKSFDSSLPIRGRDLVGLGLYGYKFGLKSYSKTNSLLIDKAIKNVGASEYASKPIGLLSGGQQQRLRIAQALIGKPKLLLCDEPLISLDLASQKTITKLINDYRVESNAAIIFVTHEINPILPWVDRVLYIANGKWVADTPENVLKAEVLTKLYGTEVEIVKLKNRILIFNSEDLSANHDGLHHMEQA